MIKSGDKVKIKDISGWTNNFKSYYSVRQYLEIISIIDNDIVILATPGYGIGYMAALIEEVEEYHDT